MKKTALLYFIILSLCPGLGPFAIWASPRFSTAGFYVLPNTPRSVVSMNPGWRFHKGDIPEAFKVEFNDHSWQNVSLPHGIEYLPLEASGCINYQGPVWYRKHFNLQDTLKQKKIFIHFEAIMGKSQIWINGHFIKEYFGGFLPIIADITPYLQFDKENIIAVKCDNSNDPLFPPGKDQDVLDFTYAGGIYRDCWLVAHETIYITDPNYESHIGGGGIFISFKEVTKSHATINYKANIKNERHNSFKGTITFLLKDHQGKEVSRKQIPVKTGSYSSCDFNTLTNLEKPNLWSPETPYLYMLDIKLQDNQGKLVDAFSRRIGIRGIEFKGADGFYLNGEPYPKPLMGVNRHQDFAVIGNALPNNLHWRDAKKIKDLGLSVIRNAHYPQDPAFMDACDELGLFVIVNTPGWQFWNENPIFEKRVCEDIRQMVRRDRSHPSVLLWEPVLNETWYPDQFAQNVQKIVQEEYPYPYLHTVCDAEAKGSEYFKVLYAHPASGDPEWKLKNRRSDVSYFTREFGDNVDDWNSHNSTSRVNRCWGEIPMLVQAQHYANPPYQCTNYNTFYTLPRQHVGGCLWHSFDHQRGYHPDPFYGGIMDIFRQPKYSYYMFMSQRDTAASENGPMVFIAHEMTPFSPPDVTVYSNCEEVKLTVNSGGNIFHYNKQYSLKGMPSPIIRFENVYDFMANKRISDWGKHYEDVYLLAEGLIGGKVVTTHKVYPSRRPTKLKLWLDNENTESIADGSDLTTIVAAITDDEGNIKRLNNYIVQFSIEGEGILVGNSETQTNPIPIRWGVAPVLVRSTTVPGKIKISARVLFEGSQMPLEGELIFETVKSPTPLLFNLAEETNSQLNEADQSQSTLCEEKDKEIQLLKKEINRYRLKEVEKQQADFGENTQK